MEKNYGFMKKAIVLFTVIFFVRGVSKHFTGHEILRSKSCINKFGYLNKIFLGREVSCERTRASDLKSGYRNSIDIFFHM